jgi:succinoglycan biosynthesis transport protein ExoP
MSNITPSNNLNQSANQEPHTPISTQYPLRPASRTSAVRIDVVKSLRLHKVTALLVMLLVLGTGLAVIAQHKPDYTAASVIYVSPTFPKTLVDDREEEAGPYETFINEHVHDITRYDILAEAIRRMPPGSWRFPGEPERNAITRLQQVLDIARIGTTYQVRIGIDGPRPEHLADIVNTLTEVYIEKAKSEEFYGRDDRLASLKEEQTRIQNDTDALLQEQDKISKTLGVASFNEKATPLVDSENAKIQTDLTSAHEQRIQAEAQLAALNNGDTSSSTSALNAAVDEVIAGDAGLDAMKRSLSQHRADLVDKLNGETEANPQRKQTEAQIAQIDKATQDMESDLRRKAAARLEQKLRTQLNQAEMVESRLNSDLQRGTQQAVDAAPKIQRAAEIQADLERLQARSAAVDDRISNLELESSSPGSVHLFSPAMTPLGPEKSKIKTLLIAIFPVSILLGVLVAVGLDLLDPHIYNGSDVEGLLGFAPIGMLFDDREVTQVVFDECALRLAAGVDHAARLAGARTFVFTGVNSGAGTTSIIENLGSMLAKLGRKTLAIDPSGNTEPVAYVTLGTDLQRRPVHFPDATPAQPSTSTELQKVRGGARPLPARIPAVNGFVFESFQSISAEYDIVLIDAAPLLISAETEYLARMADVTVLVSEAGKTKKAWLTRAARLLERLGAAGAAAVVNKVHPARAEDSLKHDMREFELRTDRVNLQEWWKPGKRAARAAQPSADPFAAGKARADEEEAVFARDI